jgi:hypothetical protein
MIIKTPDISGVFCFCAIMEEQKNNDLRYIIVF